MSIIHNSSLAYYPVAYGNKPREGRIENAVAPATDTSGNQPQRSNALPSSTEQIKAALANAGLPNDTAFNATNNTRTQKALNTYVQNHNQAAQQKVTEIISGIDLYA